MVTFIEAQTKRLILSKYLRVICVTLILAGNKLCAVDILHLPASLDAEYDVSWHATWIAHSKSSLHIDFIGSTGQQQYRLSVNSREAVWRVMGAQDKPLLSRAPLACITSVPVAFTIKRRQSVLAVLQNHRLLFTVPAPSLHGEKIMVEADTSGIHLDEIRYHPITPRLFGDDFMRPDAFERLISGQAAWQEDTVWHVADVNLSPQPTPSSASEKSRMNPWQLSCNAYPATTANGFWLLNTGNTPSAVIANATLVSSRWDRYFLEAAVQPSSECAIGLIAAYQDPQNYIAFRWHTQESHVTSPQAALFAVIDGKPTLLAERNIGCHANQWYRLRMNLDWHQLQVLVDDQLLLTATNPGNIEGRPGLYAEGTPLSGLSASHDDSQMHRIVFDDIRTGDWMAIDVATQQEYSRTTTGNWTLMGQEYVAQHSGDLVVTAPLWSRCQIATELQLPPGGQGGLVLMPDNRPGKYLMLLTEQGYEFLKLTADGQSRVLLRVPAVIPTNTWLGLRVETDGPYFTCYANARRIFDYYAPDINAITGGITAITPALRFRHFTITPGLPETPCGPIIHDGFTRDPWLSIWSSTEADWYPAIPPMPPLATKLAAPYPTDSPGLYWHQGAHYHDVKVAVPCSRELVKGQTIILTTHDDPSAGYRFTLLPDRGHGRLRVSRGELTIGEYPFRITGPFQLVVERRGDVLLAFINELDATIPTTHIVSSSLLVQYRDTDPLPTEQVGFLVTDPALPAVQVQVISSWIVDAFEQAPVGWRVGSGSWSVMMSYPCTPKWHWFCGYGADTPMIWRKLRLEGDQTVEAYLGVMMAYAGELAPYEQRFRDLRLTICAEKMQPDSGYTIIRASSSEGQPATLLLRNGVVVQRSTVPAHLLPSRDVGHKQWFALRLVKQGAEVRVYLDRHLAMTYQDPAPLAGGYAGVGTENNGVMVGRVNLAATHVFHGSPVSNTPLMPLPDNNDQ